MTNFDWYKKKIANMTLEQFAEMLANPDDWYQCDHCPYNAKCNNGESCECKEGIAVWLMADRQPKPTLKRTPVKAERLELICDCGCQMHYGGEAKYGYQKHTYVCPECGSVHIDGNVYPLVKELD